MLRHKHFITQNLCIWIALCMFLLCSCSSSKYKPLTQTGFYFDTVISITLYDYSNSDNGQRILEHCMTLASHYENLFSAKKQGSDIWNINHSKGNPVLVNSETAELLLQALLYAQLTDGIVDPTIGTLSSLWNFGSQNQEFVPSSAQIHTALTHVNYQNISINETLVTVSDPQAQIDLGFIAKGYIADKLKQYLISENISSALINLGGNVVTLGSKPNGEPFQIGIQKPFEQSGVSCMSVESEDSCIISSGNYERYFEKEDTIYFHILSPLTGYPAWSDINQVTIIGADATMCDAFSTACFILGYEKSALLLKNFPQVEAVFVTKDGNILRINSN